MAGLIIGIPHLETRPVALDWAFAFKGLNPPINYNTIFCCVRNKPVADARNFIVEEAIKQSAKYIFFLGDDTIVPPHALRQLIFRMEHDPELTVVGGIYFSKSEPPAPLVFRGNGEGSYWDWKIGEYFPVTGLGMDCTLIRVSELKKIEKPYFQTIDTDTFLDGINSAEMWTEDLYFLEKVNKTGGKVYADASVLCDHIDVFTGKVYRLPPFSLPTRQLKQEQTKKIVDLGCGPNYKEFPEGIPVRVDIDEQWSPDYRCDIRNLPFGNQEFDIVHSSHALEHIQRSETSATLKEWVRILKPDGELRLTLPDIAWAAKNISEGKVNNDTLNVLYGAQQSPHDFHYTGFTKGQIEVHLKLLGLEITDYKEEGYNMIIVAKFLEKSKDGS